MSGLETTIDQAAAANALARKRSASFCRSRYPISESTCAAAIASIRQLCEDAGMAKVKPVDRMPELVELMLAELGEDPDRQGLRATPDRVARALRELTDGYGVRAADVVVEARHLCMEMRGVQKPGGQLITSCMLGTFRKDARTRAEFLDLVRHN